MKLDHISDIGSICICDTYVCLCTFSCMCICILVSCMQKSFFRFLNGS